MFDLTEEKKINNQRQNASVLFMAQVIKPTQTVPFEISQLKKKKKQP